MKFDVWFKQFLLVICFDPNYHSAFDPGLTAMINYIFLFSYCLIFSLVYPLVTVLVFCCCLIQVWPGLQESGVLLSFHITGVCRLAGWSHHWWCLVRYHWPKTHPACIFVRVQFVWPFRVLSSSLLAVYPIQALDWIVYWWVTPLTEDIAGHVLGHVSPILLLNRPQPSLLRSRFWGCHATLRFGCEGD